MGKYKLEIQLLDNIKLELIKLNEQFKTFNILLTELKSSRIENKNSPKDVKK